MKIEVERYITNNYYLLLSISKKYTKDDEWATELLHEVILQLYDKKEMKLQLDDESIKAYIIRCLMVNWCYPSSPFFKKFKNTKYTHVELKEAIHIMNDESQIDSHRFIEIMEEEFADVSWWNKIIFEKYMVLGSLKKVSLDTKITLPSIGRYVKETKTKVKEQTIKRYENE